MDIYHHLNSDFISILITLKRPFMWINAAWLIMPTYVFTEAISHLD